jgi:hypothetical protein
LLGYDKQEHIWPHLEGAVKQGLPRPLLVADRYFKYLHNEARFKALVLAAPANRIQASANPFPPIVDLSKEF